MSPQEFEKLHPGILGAKLWQSRGPRGRWRYSIVQYCPRADVWATPHTMHLGGRWPVHLVEAHDSPVPDEMVEVARLYAEQGYRSPLALIANEKHGDLYYEASTPELLGLACLELLQRRLDDGWYNAGDEPEPVPSGQLSPEALRDDPVLYEVAVRRQASWQNRMDAYLGAVEFQQTAKKAIANRWFQEAWMLLRQRSDYEYEAVELVELAVAKLPALVNSDP